MMSDKKKTTQDLQSLVSRKIEIEASLQSYRAEIITLEKELKATDKMIIGKFNNKKPATKSVAK